MSEFTNDARKMLELVGGRENIVSFTHCATRMRFVLADDKKADVKGIEALSCVKGSFTQGGQFQVIIGNRVSQFYDEFSAVSNMDGVDKQEVKKAAKGNMNLLQRAVANLAEIFAPIIPAIIVGGLILGFRNIIGDIKLLEDGTKAITEAYPFWSGVYNFLWLAGEAIFTFLPVGVTWSVCKKMNVDQMLGIVLGITLVSPQLMSASDYVAAVEAGDPVKYWDFGSFHINMVGYQSQVIPAILVGLVFAVIYRFLKKHVPEVISMIVVPFCSLIPAIILAHTIIGPFGRMLGDGLAGVIMAFFYRFVAASMDLENFADPAPGKLTPYTAVFVFSLGVFISNFLFNTIAMKRPVEGAPVSIAGYFKGNAGTHLVGILGGVIWCIGQSFSMIASEKAGAAISYGLGQGATLVSALWGILVWHEFKNAPRSSDYLNIGMFVLFVIGLGFLIYAGA